VPLAVVKMPLLALFVMLLLRILAIACAWSEVCRKIPEHANFSVRWRAAKTLGDLAKKHRDASAPHLPHLLTLIPTKSGEDAYSVIRTIQANCKFYNYEIWQAHLAAQKGDRQTHPNSDRPITYEVNAEVVQIVENNYGTIHGKQTP